MSCLLFFGCSVVTIEDYRNPETHELRQAIIYGRGIDKLDNEVVLVPNFRTFTSSFPVRYSSLFIISETPAHVVIKSVTLTDPATDLKRTVEVNESFELGRELSDAGIMSRSVGLFGSLSESYPHFEGAKNLDLTIKISIDGGPEDLHTFSLELVEYTDIAWPT